MDFLYTNLDFTSPAFTAAFSRNPGDGGLQPGGLVFAEDFEVFAGKPYEKILAEITGTPEPPDKKPRKTADSAGLTGSAVIAQNLGGPAIVALAHAAQVLPRQKYFVEFFGVRGNDETGRLLQEHLSRLPFSQCRFTVKKGATARTDVLSDPRYNGGHGERTFINRLGVAGEFGPEDLDDKFFQADIIVFGGTALVPRLHDSLTELLRRCGNKGTPALTVVNLVYDYPGETARPGEKWNLGRLDDAYPRISLLIADEKEALKTSGCPDPESALSWFLARGTEAAVITRGHLPLYLASAGGKFFRPLSPRTLPVSALAGQELEARKIRGGPPADTTGCGDNFAGGLIAGLAEQLAAVPPGLFLDIPEGKLDLAAACVPAVAAGGFACFFPGGTYREAREGEKREKLLPYIAAYRKQVEEAGWFSGEDRDASESSCRPGAIPARAD